MNVITYIIIRYNDNDSNHILHIKIVLNSVVNIVVLLTATREIMYFLSNLM